MRSQFRRDPSAWLSAFAPVALSVLTAATLSASVSAQVRDTGAEEPERGLTLVRPDLYLVRENDQHTIVMVSPDGIVVGDPLSQRTAEWLAQELGDRFPDRPVRYVLHSYHRYDRAEGAGAFAATAEIVAHERFEREVRRARRSLPPFLENFDINFDRRLSVREAGRAPLSLMLAGKDRNGDGIVMPGELYALVPSPTLTYDSRRVISLGNTDVELIHVGSARAADMTLFLFPRQRVAFAVDVPPVTSAPFSFGAWRPQDVLAWLRAVTALDIEAVLTDRGETIRNADIVALGAYVETLMDGVRAGYAAGRRLSGLQNSDLLDAFADSPHYAARASQMATVFESLRSFTLDASVTATTSYSVMDRAYCESYTTCSAGGAVTGSAFAIDLPIGQRTGVVTELALNRHYWNARTSPLHDDETVLRQTHLALLFRYTVRRQGAFSVALLGGASYSVRDVQGLSRVKQALPPLGGRHPVNARHAGVALAAGATVARPVGDRLTIAVPVRVTSMTQSAQDPWPHRLDVRVGVGLAISIPRRPL